MQRLTALLGDPLRPCCGLASRPGSVLSSRCAKLRRIIGSGIGFGARLIAARDLILEKPSKPWFCRSGKGIFPLAISRPPEPLGGADQAELHSVAAPLGGASVVKTGSAAPVVQPHRKV